MREKDKHKQEIRSYRDLVAWQKAMVLVTEVYKLTEAFPAKEMFGLTGQLRRTAVSIPSNIAEGYGRTSTGEYRQFLGHARGALWELETQVCIAYNLGYLNPTDMQHLLDLATEIGRTLHGLLSALKR